MSASSYPLAILSILFAVVAAFYYLKLVLIMYSPAPATTEAAPSIPPAAGVALALTSLFTLAFGLVPGLVVDFAHQATLLF
jgi:NADH-quinone oxidoreductase subunit N